MAKMPSMNFMELCRLCLVKEEVSVPIFEGEGDNRQIFVKIAACLPVKVERDDKLPKKICDSCLHKVENVYQFWNTTANSEKQLLRWLEETKTDDYSKRDSTIETEQLMVKEESVEEEGQDVKGGDDQVDLEGSDGVNSISDDESNSDDSPTVSDMGEDVQEVADKEDGDSEDLEDEDDEELEPTTFVNVSMGCEDQPGPSGAQVRMEDDPVAVDTPRPVGQPRIAPAPGPKLLPKPAQPAQLVAATAIQPAPTATAAASTSKAVALPSGLSSGDTFVSQQDSPANCELDQLPKKQKVLSRFLISTCPTSTLSNDFQNANQFTNSSVNNLIEENKGLTKGEGTLTYTCATQRECEDKLDSQGNTDFAQNGEVQVMESALSQQNNASNKAVKAYRCASCGFKTEIQDGLREHIRSRLCDKEALDILGHSDEASILRRNYAGPRIQRPGKYTCSVCDKKFPYSKSLYRHQRGVHKMEPSILCQVCDYQGRSQIDLRNHKCNSDFECNVCHKKFEVKRDLVRHEKRHIKKHSCEFCGKSFGTKQYLTAHRDAIHFSKRLTCKICNKTFAFPVALKLHLNLHQGVGKLCEMCGKLWTTSEALRLHQLTHSGVRAFMCEVCGFMCSTSQALQMHLPTHSGKRPFACDVCKKAFSRRCSLHIHKRYHTGEKPHLCRVCGAGFVSATLLRRHESNH